MKIDKIIAQKRKEKGWTQLELADKLGVSDKTVSKWESGNGLPDTSIIPALAKALGVSIDYLMTGEQEEPKFSLDDLEPKKRALYLIEHDDIDNFVRYKLVNANILVSAPIADIQPAAKKENKLLREKIVSCQSIKIFSALAQAFLAAIKHNEYYFMISNSSSPSKSPACLVSDYLDDFVKLCALSNQVDILSIIKFKSFSVVPSATSYKVEMVGDMYPIKQETLDFILCDNRVPRAVFNYVTKYDEYANGHVRGGFNLEDTSNAIRMAENVLISLIKAKREDTINAYLESLKKEAQRCFDSAVCNDRCWRSSYYFGNYGYMFYRNGNGSMETIECTGKILVINQAIKYAIKVKDKAMALKLSEYNLFVRGLLAKLPDYKKQPDILLADGEAIDKAIDEEKRKDKIDAIRSNISLSEKTRREKLFALDALSVAEAIEADDYDLFVQFPFEKTKGISIANVALNCKDVRFYIYAISLGQPQYKLDAALGDVLRLYPERNDLIEVLLSAGAVVTDNPALTLVLKQNVAILANKQSRSSGKDIEINQNETEKSLLKALKAKRYEYVIVNLTIILEKKLKSRYGSGIQLIDMINMAAKESRISPLQCSMLHNLRKSRNTILHEGDEKGFYTPEIIKEWISVVFSL